MPTCFSGRYTLFNRIKSYGADEPPFLQSFFMGGFECSTHRRQDGRRIDVIESTRHHHECAIDYQLLSDVGIRTVRDGLRWHLIEIAPEVYDWSSFFPMLRIANATGTQVIWDFCHWGVPDWLDVFSDTFASCFAKFCAAAAKLIYAERARAGLNGPQLYCAINEVSFWSWVGGDEQYFHPFAQNRGRELKRQLVSASIAAMHAVRCVDPSARFVQPEPIIQISINPRDRSRDLAADAISANAHTAAQFETWDMLAGLRNPELGGEPALLDIIGVNYYWDNQWIHEGARTPPGHLQHRALHVMLHDIWKRYQRPIIITETGAEANATVGWLGYICAEVRQAQRMGVPVVGICLYPIMDYPGWDDDRHCSCGVIELAPDWSARKLRQDICDELQLQWRLFEVGER